MESMLARTFREKETIEVDRNYPMPQYHGWYLDPAFMRDVAYHKRLYNINSRGGHRWKK